MRTSSGRCSRYSSIARCSTLSATVVIARRITAWIDSAAPGSTQHDRAWIPPGRSALDSALLRQARQSLDRLSGSWEPWLLLPLQLVYLARPVSAGKLAPQALICMIPLTTALSLFQVSDLFAQSDLSWSLLLGDLSRSAGAWGVAPAVPSLREAFQNWCRLFIEAHAGTAPVTAPTACTLHRSHEAMDSRPVPFSPEAIDSDFIFQIQLWKSNLRNIWPRSC